MGGESMPEFKGKYEAPRIIRREDVKARMILVGSDT
jgi:hypothetical protein